MRKNYFTTILVIILNLILFSYTSGANNSNDYQNIIKKIINLKVTSIHFDIENNLKINKEEYKKSI